MTTNNHPAHGPVSLDRLHQIREILSKAAAQSDGGNLGYAMADAVKVIDGAIAAFGDEPVGYFYAEKPGDWYQISDGDKVPAHRRIPLYSNPQSSPVVKLPNEFISSEGIVVQIEKLMAVLAVHGIQYERRGNAFRAATLHDEPVSNSDELPLDYLQGHKDGLEWAAQQAEANHPQTGDWLYDDPIELARAIRKGPDMPTVQGGNSPVTPDGWISCSDRMPEDTKMLLAFSQGKIVAAYWNWVVNTIDYKKYRAFTYLSGYILDDVTHWMPLPEPPQEAK